MSTRELRVFGGNEITLPFNRETRRKCFPLGWAWNARNYAESSAGNFLIILLSMLRSCDVSIIQTTRFGLEKSRELLELEGFAYVESSPSRISGRSQWLYMSESLCRQINFYVCSYSHVMRWVKVKRLLRRFLLPFKSALAIAFVIENESLSNDGNLLFIATSTATSGTFH